MKPKTTIILIVLLAGCVAYILLRHTNVFEPPPAPEQDKQVFATSLAEPIKVTIASSDKPTIVLEKRDGQWWLGEPIQAEVETYRVEDVTRMLKHLEYERTFWPDDETEGIPDEQTGLDEPRWTVTVEDDTGQTFILHIGKHVPLSRGAQTYVRPDGEGRTYVVAQDFHAELRRNVDEYRRKTVLRINVDDIVRVRIAGKETFELAKTGKDTWEVVWPVQARADTKEVRSFIDRFSHIRATKFIDDNPEDLSAYGLDNPRVVATAWVQPDRPAGQSQPATTSAPATGPATAPATQPKAPEKHVIRCGRVVGERVYAQVSGRPSVFFMERNVMENLQPDLLTLRDKRILDAKINDIVEVKLNMPDGEAHLRKQDDTWTMIRPFRGPANRATVNTLLANLTLPKIESFHDQVATLGGYGLEEPRAEIAVRKADQEGFSTVRIGGMTPSGEMTFVAADGIPSVGVVRTSDADRLLAKPANYWSTTLTKLKSDEKIAEIRIDSKGVGYHLVRDAADRWRLREPVNGKANPGEARKIAEALRGIDASQIVALSEKLPDEYSEPDEEIVVRFRTETPQEPPDSQPTTQAATSRPAPAVKEYSLRIVKKADAYYAWRDDESPLAVGEVTEELYETLSGELRNPVVWSVQPQDVRRIVRTAGDETLELVRRKDEWTCPQDPYVTIDGEKVTGFLREIRTLRADRFVDHSSEAVGKFGLDQPWLQVQLDLTDDRTLQLKVSDSGPSRTENRYAWCDQVDGVFVLTAETIAYFTKALSDFTK